MQRGRSGDLAIGARSAVEVRNPAGYRTPPVTGDSPAASRNPAWNPAAGARGDMAALKTVNRCGTTAFWCALVMLMLLWSQMPDVHLCSLCASSQPDCAPPGGGHHGWGY